MADPPEQFLQQLADDDKRGDDPRMLGNYVLLEQIGAGGMGQVFKAQHRVMQRTVAIKLLGPKMMQDPAAVARFQREVKAAARLNHPHIVTAFDADCADGVHFLVMEYVEGSDLAEVVKWHGPLSVQQAVDYVTQAARGLAAAHAEGIVHRDIKPGNLLLDTKGAVRILDMGLARIDAAPGEEEHTELTQDGTVMGTVDYMAPEQARDTHAADARADIYSLGCTLHYLLTGKPVYGGEALMAKLVAHRTKPIPSLCALRSDVPEQLDAVFRRMVAKDVADRYQSISNLLADLKLIELAPASSNETRQFTLEDTHTGLTDLLKGIAVEPPPIAARKTTPHRRSVLNGDWFKQHKRLVSIAAGIAGIVLLAAAVIVGRQMAEGTRVVEVDKSDDTRSVWARPVPGIGPLAFKTPGFEDWARSVSALPAEAQLPEVVNKLVALNPGFGGQVTGNEGHGPPKIEDGMVTELDVASDQLFDVSPLRALTDLRILGVHGKAITDLSPLRGMKLTHLYCGSTSVADLSPLQEMDLTFLDCSATPVSDLSPLNGVPLTSLYCHQTQVADLSPLSTTATITFIICDNTPVSDLSPLANLKLQRCYCNGTQISDLSTLKGMPLYDLACASTRVADLSPIKDLPLTTLVCDFNTYRDEDLLRSIATLERINNGSSADFWNAFNARQAAFEAWVTGVTALPAEEQVNAVASKLKELNPGFDGNLTSKIEDDAVAGLELSTDNVTDISPVRALAQLRALSCGGSDEGKGKLADWWPLRGMRLADLDCHASLVADLRPLRGMPLSRLICPSTKVSDLSPLTKSPVTELNIDGTQVIDLSPLAGLSLNSLTCKYLGVSDLTPLKGMSMTHLDFAYTSVSDLTPLRGIPLRSLIFYSTGVTDLSPLSGMQLETVRFDNTPVSEVTPLTGMPIASLFISSTKVSDLSPIKDMPLVDLWCDIQPYRDLDTLRAIKSLNTINDQYAAEFWKVTDEKQAAVDAWTRQVAALPAEKHVAAVAKKLRELNPAFDGKQTHKIENGAVTELKFLTDNVTDISPVRALPELRVLHCNGGTFEKGQLVDLWPLHGLPLTDLSFNYTKVADLSPLAGMPLTRVSFEAAPVADLSPLVGMPLTHLNIRSTLTPDLAKLADMRLTRLDMAATKIVDLSPLRDMQLESLCVHWSTVADLSPLAGMPLNDLVCFDSRVTDLSPLRGMPLTIVWCDFNYYRDADILRSIPTLATINNKSVADFWKKVDLQQAAFDDWAKQVATRPAEEQVTAVMQKLQERNPGFDGTETHKIDAGVVTVLTFLGDNVSDISLVRALSGLTQLHCGGSGAPAKLTSLAPLQGMSLTFFSCANTPVSDLSPLTGMPLTYLVCRGTAVSDLAPLKGMALAYFECSECAQVSDLTPLKGMPLNGLAVHGTRIKDLAPLKGMPLEGLDCHNTAVTDLSPLTGLPLTLLNIGGTNVSDLSPLTGMPITSLHLHQTQIADLTPLTEMPLKDLGIDVESARDAELLRSIKTKPLINGKPAAEFLKKFDAQHAGK